MVEQEGRLVQLDVLRAIAVLLVFCRHGIIPPASGRLEPLAQSLHRLGWTGVDLFFVLSGFLVGGLLFSELKNSGKLDAPRFLIRRGFKIWPSYFAYLLFLLVVLRRDTDALWLWVYNLVHVQNYFGTPRPHTW